MRLRDWPSKVYIRRVQIVKLWNNDPTVLTCTGIRLGKRLGVSRWTVYRDLSFLAAHNCLSINRADHYPFKPLEVLADLLCRFKKVHQKGHICAWCRKREKQQKRRHLRQ